jgi:predicted metal-dependent hydrolase
MEMERSPSLGSKKYSDNHPNALRGIDMFNQKQFFAAHEELEIAWRAEAGGVKELYRAILQVGVAYYQISRKNFVGAKKMFERAFNWLNPYPAVYYGINVLQLKKDAETAYTTLLTLGEDHIASFPPYLFKPLLTDNHKE